MFAVGLARGKRGVQGFEVPMPRIEQDDQVLIRVVQVGLDGTDFRLVRYDEQDIAPGREGIVLGHEMLGRAEAAGPAVQGVKPGDPVTLTIRRGCGLCHPCLHNQSDMCLTGLYTERGIHRTDGFLTEYVVEEEQYVVKVPPDLKEYAVLTEPLSIAGKGIEQIKTIQGRLPWACPHPGHGFAQEDWGACKTALIVGAGPLGLLATALFRLAGVSTYVAEVVPEESLKVRLAKKLGAHYIDVRDKAPKEIVDLCCTAGNLDIIFEASGASQLALSLIPFMSRSSIYVMTGIPRGELRAEFDANEILRHIVRYNQVIVGSISSNRRHFEQALEDMGHLIQRFGPILAEVITHRFPLREYEKAFALQDPNQIKVVVEVSPWS